MAITTELEADILRCYRAEKWRTGTIARQLHVHHGTVRRVLGQAGLDQMDAKERRPSIIGDFLPVIRQTLERYPTLAASRLYEIVRELGYTGGADHFRHLISCLRPKFDSPEWMLAVLQKKIGKEDLIRDIGDCEGLEILLHRLYTGSRFDRNKALSILACQRGLTIDVICDFLGISSTTYSRYKQLFASGGSQALFARQPRPLRSNDESLKKLIFKVLHEPPITYGINRTTWTMLLLRKVLSENGSSACPGVIRTITRAAGYHWRKARIVLTSKDPAYSEKVDHIHSILANLQTDEAFFSIDEYGPFAIKMYGGRKLSGPDDRPVVPQWQKSRGSLILTAALDLSSNQVTHFYSDKKNTDEMIKMMDVLLIKYADRRKIYLSWDAASWHIAKRLNQRLDAHNTEAATSGHPLVAAAPLPSGAQFLNVIE